MTVLDWPEGINAQDWSDVAASMPAAVEALAGVLRWTAQPREHGGTLVPPEGAELEARLDWKNRASRRLCVSVHAPQGSRHHYDPHRPRTVTVSLSRPLAVCAREIERRTRPHREWYLRTVGQIRTERGRRERAVALLLEMGFVVPERLAESEDPLKVYRYLDGSRIRAVASDGEEPGVTLELERLSPDIARRVMALVQESM